MILYIITICRKREDPEIRSMITDIKKERCWADAHRDLYGFE